MTGLLHRAMALYRREGASGVLRNFAARLGAAFGYQSDITRARLRVARLLRERHGNRAAYGPFKGMALDATGWWNAYDVPAMILGAYECEVQARLQQLSGGRELLVVLGAADGFYAIGALHAGMFASGICFETSEKGRQAIAENARLNNVAGRIDIRGSADADFLASLPRERFGVMALLCDVEGAEYDILSRANLSALRQAAIIVELHEFSDLQKARAEQFLADARAFFEVEILYSGARDPSAYPELAGLPDHERLLAFSEGRPNAMRWAVLTPLDSSAM